MLRRFSIATRLFWLVGLVVLFAALALFFAVTISSRLENLVVSHTQTIMLQGEKGKIKAATHSMAMALSEALKFARDDFERRQLAMVMIDPVRFEDDLSGYFFIYQGTVNVALPPRAGLQGKDLADFEDRDGVHYVQELHRQAKAGGGFVSYYFPKPSGPEERKLSYAEMIPGTDMWVGTGVYIDNVAREEARISSRIEMLFNDALRISGGVGAVLAAVLAALCVAIARSVARPLAEATEAAERIASGDLEVRLRGGGRDEAARLQESLNRMAGLLRQNIQEIQARREEAEEKAQQAQQALGEARRANQEVVAQVALRIESLQKISDAVAHQLRNPTTIIGGLAGLLLKKPRLKESYLEYLDGIIDAARRIELITAAVKQYSSIRLGSLGQTPAEDVLGAALASGQALARGLGRNVTWEMEPGGVTALADRDLLAMALTEVTANAVEALPDEGGRVSLSARETEEGVEFVVADTGRGVTEEEREYLFDPFFTTKSVGVGMGLTKAHRVMQEHGGGIAVESEPGRGSTFRLSLPRIAATP